MSPWSQVRILPLLPEPRCESVPWFRDQGTRLLRLVLRDAARFGHDPAYPRARLRDCRALGRRGPRPPAAWGRSALDPGKGSSDGGPVEGTPTGHRRAGIHLLPRTRLGLRAVGLSIAFVAFFILGASLAAAG